jgi:hypothetical protein
MGQGNLQGNWFMFSRNRIIQFSFTNSEIVTSQMNWDLHVSDRHESDTQKILATTKSNGNIYFYVERSEDSANKIRVNTFKVIRPNKEILLAINTADTSFSDTTAIRQYIDKDNNEKYGLILYSETEIHRLKQQKKISEMTVADFKLYASKLIEFKNKFDSLSKSPAVSANSLIYYSYSLLRQFIGELGYNPLITNTEYDDFITRFQNIPETKSIVDQLMNDL